MNALKIVALVLILSGIVGLVIGGFNYTKKTHEARLGDLEFSVQEKETVNIPVWAGVAVIVVGSGLLFIPSKK